MANRTRVVHNDDGTMIEPSGEEEQDTSSSRALTTPHTVASVQPRTHAAIRQPRPTMTAARGRGHGRAPGSHYFGAGGQHYPGDQPIVV